MIDSAAAECQNLPMPSSRAASLPPATGRGRWWRGAILAPLAGLVSYTAWRALAAPLATADFPEGLAVKAELLPVVFPLHMVTGGLALLLVPAAMAASARPRWHRPLARIAALDVAVAGLTALPVALVAPVTTASALGFAAQGLVWLALLGAGIAAIRRGDTARHRTCMMLMAAATSGAVFFRVWLALWALVGDPRRFEAFYAFDAWFAWGLPVALTVLWLKHEGKHKGSRHGKP